VARSSPLKEKKTGFQKGGAGPLARRGGGTWKGRKKTEVKKERTSHTANI